MDIPTATASTSDLHPTRACTACRSAKVRCLPNPHPSSHSVSKICLRCSKTSRTCVFTAPRKRKARKRTDTRVAELEREVQAMRALFDKKLDEDGKKSLDIVREEDEDDDYDIEHTLEGTTRMTDENASEPGSSRTYLRDTCELPDPQPYTPANFSPEYDVIDRSIVDEQESYQLFYLFVEDLCPKFPLVLFPPKTDPAEIRRTKPTLFLACIAAAAGTQDPHLFSMLTSETLTAYAYRTVMHSEKSLELVQAMLVTSIWYYPPGRFAQLKVYEYIHMASSMAIDLGISNEPNFGSGKRHLGLSEDNHTDKPKIEVLDEEELQKRRTILVCYMTTTAASIGMRRPNALRFNRWLGDCVDVIANNPAAPQSDMRLVAWVKLLKITDEIGTAFLFDDPCNMPSIAEPRVQIMITGFEKKLEAWKVEFEGVRNESTMMQYFHAQLYLHEIGLHDDHPPGKFMPPWTLPKIISIDINPQSAPANVNCIAVSISSAHSLLDTLLGMSIETIRAIPLVNFVRSAYCMITLISIYISAKSLRSKIGAVISPESVRLDYYFNAIVEKLVQAVGPKEFRAPATFLGMIMRWQNWFEGQQNDQYFVPPTDFPPVDVFWLPPVAQERAKNSGMESGKSSSDGSSNFGSNDLDTKHTLTTDNFENMDLNSQTNIEMNYQLPNEFQYSENERAGSILPADTYGVSYQNFADWIPAVDTYETQVPPLVYPWVMPDTINSPERKLS